jgi:hypothetical protein
MIISHLRWRWRKAGHESDRMLKMDATGLYQTLLLVNYHQERPAAEVKNLIDGACWRISP